jgi:hypothetical protein
VLFDKDPQWCQPWTIKKMLLFYGGYLQINFQQSDESNRTEDVAEEIETGIMSRNRVVVIPCG